MKDTFIDIVKEYLTNNPDLNYSGIADLIKNSGKINRSHRTLRLYVAEVDEMIDNGDFDLIGPDDILIPDNDNVSSVTTHFKNYPTMDEAAEEKETSETDKSSFEQFLDHIDKDGTSNELDEKLSIEDDIAPISVVYTSDLYTIENDSFNDWYSLNYSSKIILVRSSIVDKTFLAHSRSGLNLTEQQVIRLLDLTDIEFKAIKARLFLCKDSETSGPYTIDQRTPEDIFDLISIYTTELLEKLSEIDDPIRSVLIRETRKQYILSQNKNLKFESYIELLKSHVKDIECRPLKSADSSAPSDEITIVIADLHLGVVSDKFNMEIAEEKLSEIVEIVNGIRGNGINVILPGDIMHNISGVMHPNSWKNTETGMWGSDAITKPFELIYNFLLSINNLNSVYIVGGNHDRLNADKKLENTAEGAKLLAYMLNALLPISVSVEFDSRLLKFASGNLFYIVQHGDLGADKKRKVEEVVWQHGEQDKFNIVINAHHHSRIIARGDDIHNAIRISAPSFSPTDDYSKDCGYSNNPGILIFREKQGRPVVVDIPLIY